MNHGIFTFANDAKESYSLMIKYVSKAEQTIKKLKVKKIPAVSASTMEIAKTADRNVNKRNTKTSAPKIDIPNSIISSD